MRSSVMAKWDDFATLAHYTLLEDEVKRAHHRRNNFETIYSYPIDNLF